MTSATLLEAFVRESNRIEGIHRPPRLRELEATEEFLAMDVIEVADLERFVEVVAPGATLRVRSGMDVRVGSHRPPPGGSYVRGMLEAVLRQVREGAHPHPTHVEYEILHPFTDGNGRSGRALWAWQMTRLELDPGLQLGFLHAFYYQTLERAEARRAPCRPLKAR